jgi:hypothetical protein
MSTITVSPAHLAALASPGFIADFGLARARLLLAVGSHVAGTADASSDIDFLAVFDQAADIPADVALAGVVAMHSPAGPNWIGSLPDGREVNVEMVSTERLGEFGALLAPSISSTWAPILQALDIRLLDRIRTGVPVSSTDPAADSEYLDQLRARLRVDRLPLLVLVMNYCGAASYLARAEKNAGDPFTVRFGLDAVAGGMTVATLCLFDIVTYGMKKGPRLLREAEREHPDLPFRIADLEQLWLGGEPRTQLAAAGLALGRLRAYVRDRAARGDGMCIEAGRGFAALTGEDG